MWFRPCLHQRSTPRRYVCLLTAVSWHLAAPAEVKGHRAVASGSAFAGTGPES